MNFNKSRVVKKKMENESVETEETAIFNHESAYASIEKGVLAGDRLQHFDTNKVT